MAIDPADRAKIDQLTAVARDYLDVLVDEIRPRIGTVDEAVVTANLAARMLALPKPVLTGMLVNAAIRLAKRQP